MRCVYCEKGIVGQKDVVVVVGKGPAHEVCYEQNLISLRIFKGLCMSTLSVDELLELKEMAMIELNSRDTSESDIELFG